MKGIINMTAKASEILFSTSERVAPLSIINALIVAIGRKNRVALENTFNDLEKIWDEYDVYEAPKLGERE